MTTPIVILGGGMSSLVTAFELTSLPDWKDRYTITIYQQGWRLGGKGASGRNAAASERNEEHGLHLLFGCYENAFRILRRCYEEVVRGPGELPWRVEDAFKPHHTITMYEERRSEWLPWELEFPSADGIPGEGPPLALSPLTYLKLLVRWARQHAERLAAEVGAPTQAAVSVPPLAHLERAESLLGHPDVARALLGLLPLAAEPLDAAVALLDEFKRWTRPETPLPDRLRRFRIIIDFALTVARGLVVDRVIVPRENWFRIDGQDLRAWLAHHGASDETCHSAVVQGLYDAVFTPPTLGAGTILHALMRASHYKGAVIYKMQAGMGDTIFAPLYRVLAARGVEFRFFHRVERLELPPDRRRIARVVFDRQVELRGAGYDPLRTVKDLPCWPSEPRWDLIERRPPAGTDLEDWWDPWRGAPWTLELGDSDLLVLGISIGAFPDICRQLIDDPGKTFGTMVGAVRTTQTQGVQLWLGPTLPQLGWRGQENPVVVPYANPLNTWADMSHLLEREDFPRDTVRTLAYHCAKLDDAGPPPSRPSPGFSASERARVLAQAREWLERYTATIWPLAAPPGRGFDWGLLFDPAQRPGPDRLRAQHVIATSNPSDRYVWSVVGSSAERLRTDESGYENLYLTGDWILTALSIGCLEAATMAGIQTARAIDRRVPRAVHDWLPERKGGTP